MDGLGAEAAGVPALQFKLELAPVIPGHNDDYTMSYKNLVRSKNT